jgi:hypothetical protein
MRYVWHTVKSSMSHTHKPSNSSLKYNNFIDYLNAMR